MRRLARATVAFAMAATLALSGCAGYTDVSFPATAANIQKVDCAKLTEVRKAFELAHGAPDGSPLRSELATKWKITTEEAYAAALTEFDSKRGACNTEAAKETKKPDPSASSSSSATPSAAVTASATAAATTTTAAPTASMPPLKSIYSWQGLLTHLDKIGEKQRFLDRVNAAQEQLGFNSTDIETWAKLNIECRVIVAFDDGLLDDATANKIAADKVATLPSGNILHAPSSVQVAGGPRTNLSGDDRVQVILVPIKNGARTPTAGIELSEGLRLLLIAK